MGNLPIRPIEVKCSQNGIPYLGLTTCDFLSKHMAEPAIPSTNYTMQICEEIRSCTDCKVVRGVVTYFSRTTTEQAHEC